MNIHVSNNRPALEGSGCIMVTTGEPTKEPKYYLLSVDGENYEEMPSYEHASAEFGRRILEVRGYGPAHKGLYPFAKAHALGVPVTSLKEWVEHYRFPNFL